MMYLNLRKHQTHSMSEEKDRKLATNRLLDILRSQQTTKSVEDDKSIKVEKTVIDEKEQRDDVVEKQPVEEKKVLSDTEAVTPEEDVSSGINEEPPVTDEKPDIDPESSVLRASEKKEISTGDLLNTLKSVQSDPSVSEEKKVGEETKTEPKVEKPEPKAAPATESNIPETSTTAPTNLLEQIQKPDVKPKPKEIEEIQPKKFDSSLLSTLSEKKQKKTFQDNLLSLFHLFNESQRRITICSGENHVRLLQIKTGFKRTEIEKVKEYTLPYKTEEGAIENNSELIHHILQKELDPKEVKYAYGAYYSPEVDTKTHILQAPVLSKKEISDLVEWNVKKNIPFSPDEAIIAYETSKEPVNNSEKHNIVIGVSEKNTVEKAIDLFNGSKLKPRFISTLPVLMWKLFLLNYPDCKSGCYILVHLGENNTTVSLVKDQQLLMTREILFGAEDFYKAAMQKVVTEDQTFKIDYSMAKQLLAEYGIPDDTRGVTLDSHISLYKLSIFLRPALERLTSELNRSMKYFTKQIPDLEWTEMFFDGNCATFPNLVAELGKNLYVKVGLLNPMRKGSFHVKNDDILLNDQMPLYTINFALASENSEKINVIPKKLLTNFKYLFLYKVAAVISALILPIFIVSTIISGYNIEHLEKEIETRSKQWDKLSIQAKEYIGFVTDIDILNGYKSFLENDRKHSINQVKILKLFSAIVPDDIKLTSISFIKVSVESDADENDTEYGIFKPGVEITGFVQAEASISDIHLTNFVMKLKHLNIFSKVEYSVDETTKNTEGKLFFSLNMEI